MKLAEALSERADLQKRLAQLKTRLNNNAWVQEGETPAEDPALLMEELTVLTRQLETLVTRINLTNAATVSEGETLTALLSRRDALAQHTAAMRDFLDEASRAPARAARSEIKILPSVSVPDCRKQTDALSKQLRELDTRIQALNWTTELI